MCKQIKRSRKRDFCTALWLAMALTLGWTLCAQAADLQVTWNANTEGDLAGYRVFCGTAPGVYTAKVTVGKDATSYLLAGLDEGTTYYVALTAFDTSANESGFSAEVSASTGDQAAPDPPTGLKVARPVSGLGSR